MIDLDHAANRGIVSYLRSRASDDHEPQRDPKHTDSYSTPGTHPEMVERLWDELGGALPENCSWVLYGRPVLVHPRTGVVFGFAGGSMTYALRLPDTARTAAITAGAQTQHQYPAYPELKIAASMLDLATFGREWVFGAWLESEREWCLAAFEHAGQTI